MSDPFGLQRFVEAQDAGGAYERALSELRLGRKRSHWMWFVRHVLDRCFDGTPDETTERLLSR